MFVARPGFRPRRRRHRPRDVLVGGTLCPGVGFSPRASKLDFTLDDWRKLVICVFTYFDGRIVAYEIWNELTQPEFQFRYPDGSPERSMDMLSSAAEIILANDPDATIVGLGGLLLWSGGDATPVQHDRQFADRLLRLGAAKFVDAISVHAYDWGAYGNWVWDAFEQNLG